MRVVHVRVFSPQNATFLSGFRNYYTYNFHLLSIPWTSQLRFGSPNLLSLELNWAV